MIKGLLHTDHEEYLEAKVNISVVDIRDLLPKYKEQGFRSHYALRDGIHKHIGKYRIGFIYVVDFAKTIFEGDDPKILIPKIEEEIRQKFQQEDTFANISGRGIGTRGLVNSLLRGLRGEFCLAERMPEALIDGLLENGLNVIQTKPTYENNIVYMKPWIQGDSFLYKSRPRMLTNVSISLGNRILRDYNKKDVPHIKELNNNIQEVADICTIKHENGIGYTSNTEFIVKAVWWKNPKIVGEATVEVMAKPAVTLAIALPYCEKLGDINYLGWILKDNPTDFFATKNNSSEVFLGQSDVVTEWVEYEFAPQWLKDLF